MFRDSLKALKTVRGLTVAAMLLAAQLVLGMVSSVYLTPGNKISFTFLALSLTGQILGPVGAMIVGFLASFLGWLIRPVGGYFPGYDISWLLTGFVFGVLFYRRRPGLGRVALAKLIVSLFINIGLNTLWTKMLMGTAFMVELPARALKNAVLYPIEVLLLMLLFSALAKPLKLPAKNAEAQKRTGRNSAIAVICVLALCVGIWANNTSLLVQPEDTYKLIAHRGLAQTFPMDEVKWDTDTSKIIYPPEHEYLENTIPAMREAFRLGASVVELDIYGTKDNRLAVFHDYLLDYRTDARGLVEEYTMDELKKLDIGYGYTADDGRSWPFRGKGIGMMPELYEVFQAFPDNDLLIHIKGGGTRVGELLYQEIKDFDDARLARIQVYGDSDAMIYLNDKMPGLITMSKNTLLHGLIEYMAIGWSGYVPDSIRHTEVHVPLRYARFLWGWPAKFVQRMDSVGTRVVLVDGDGEFSEGFDDLELLSKVPKNFAGYIWTNRIDRMGETKG